MADDTIDLSHSFGGGRRYQDDGPVTLVLDEEGARYVADVMRKEFRDSGARQIAEELEKVLDRRIQEWLDDHTD